MSRLQKAIDYLDIKGWLEQYVGTKPASKGNFRVQQCPKCLNSNWKLYIHEENKRWYCQVCQWGVGISDVCVLLSELSEIPLLQIRIDLMKQVSPAPTNDEYVNTFLGIYNNEVEEIGFDIDPITLPGSDQFEGVIGNQALRYAYERGLTDTLINKFKLRFCNKLQNAYGPWLVFPIYYYGVPVSYQGRKINNNSEPKYISHSNIDKWMWPLDSLENSKSIVITEGVFDSLGFQKAGLDSVCNFGKSIKRQQVQLLKYHNIENIYIAYDPEGTWQSVKRQISQYGHLFHVFIVDLKFEGDPGDVLTGLIPKEELINSFNNAIDTRSPDYLDFLFRKDFT